MIAPDPLVTRALLRRGAFLWVGTRVLFGFASLLTAGVFGSPSIGVAPHTAIGLACLVGVLGLLEARRRNEHLFLANLGVSQWPIWLISVLPALLGECLIALAIQW
jgi:hypothetical protein